MKLHEITLIIFVFVWVLLLIAFPLWGIINAAFSSGFPALINHMISPQTIHALFLTIIITFFAVVINSVFGIILALVFARQHFKFKALMEEIINLPLAVSPVVAGFMFILLLGPNGWLGNFFCNRGIQIIFALPGMIIVTIFTTLPFVAKEIAPVLRSLGTEQEDAATSLGASSWQTFFHVTLPSIRWGLLYGIMLTIARSLGEFGAVLVVSGSIIGITQTATLHIHQEFSDFHYQSAFAASLILAILSVVLLMTIDGIKKFSDAKQFKRS